MSRTGPLDVLALSRAHHHMRRLLARILNEHRIGPTDWFLLQIVAREPDGLRLSETARYLSLKPPLVTMIATRLLGQALLERVAHPTDKRAKLLRITPQGGALLRTTRQALQERLDHSLRNIDPADLKAYHKVIDALVQEDEGVYG